MQTNRPSKLDIDAGRLLHRQSWEEITSNYLRVNPLRGTPERPIISTHAESMPGPAAI